MGHTTSLEWLRALLFMGSMVAATACGDGDDAQGTEPGTDTGSEAPSEGTSDSIHTEGTHSDETNSEGTEGGGTGEAPSESGPEGTGEATHEEPSDSGDEPGTEPGSTDGPDPGAGWPEGNEWSWDGSFAPDGADFPLSGLLDDEYFDGHMDDGEKTPILPPGEWDWDDAKNDLANWRNFEKNLGHFEMLKDSKDRHYGWRLIGNTPGAVDYAGPASYFEGSSGPDIMELGPKGLIHSFGKGNLSDGPDILVFQKSYSLDFRTGSSESGAKWDNDLVVGGCGANPDGSFDIETTTIHTGPGADWVFVRDISRAAIDLGDGENGRTDAIDPNDGNDFVMLRGNTHDFRVMGGRGDDVAVWYIDETIQTKTWLGPNFFGGGAFGDALWDDEGTDRLVLAIPSDTPITEKSPPPGSVMVRGTDGETVLDDPTQADPYARYCVECGESPEGRRTVIIEYNSADDEIHTGYFYVTAFEELQIGVGDGARVYAIDDITGTVTSLDAAVPFAPPPWPTDYCE